MNKNTVYILQKDLPNAKAGDKYESTDSGENYINLNAMATWDVSYPKEYIENNSDWFVKEEVNESKSTEQFIWTDELAIEFARFTNTESTAFQGRYADLELFKQSKSKKEEPQWEILDFLNTDGRELIIGKNSYGCWYIMENGVNDHRSVEWMIKKGYPIKTVK